MQVQWRAQLSPGGMWEDCRRAYGKNGMGCAPWSIPFITESPLRQKESKRVRKRRFFFTSLGIPKIQVFSGDLREQYYQNCKALKLYISTVWLLLLPKKNPPCKTKLSITKYLISSISTTRETSSVGHSELRFSFQIVMELKRIKEKENEFVSEKNGKGLSEQMRYLSSHGGMFLSRKNDFPFYTTCTAGCCTQLHCICLSFKHISASHLFSSLYLPTHPPRLPSSMLPVQWAAGYWERGRQPKSLITRKRSHLALTNSIPHKFAFPPHNIT